MASTTHDAGFAPPPDVAAFVGQEGVAAELSAIVRMTRHVFPNASVGVSIEKDPEIEGDRHLVVQVQAGKVTVEEALQRQARWHSELLQKCPAPRAHVFRLDLRLSP